MNTNFGSVDKNNSLSKIPVKGFISGIAILAFIILFIVLWSQAPAGPQIADTNGDEDYSLQTITDIDIISNSVKSTGLKKGTNDADKTVSCKSRNFSGTEHLSTTEFGGQGNFISIKNFELNGGNIRLAVIENGEIVYEFAPNRGVQSFKSDANYIDVILAGESADFELIYTTK